MQTFTVRRRFTMMINRYEVRAGDGPLVAFVEQKRMALKDQVTIYTDESRSAVLAGFKDRRVVIAMAVALDARQGR